jgi:hypothetical protein
MIAALVVMRSATPVNDLDAYWHVQVGREILARHTLDGLGANWLAQPPPSWLTSQWLTEVAMNQLVDTAGWRGLVVVRVALLLAIVVVVIVSLLPRRPALLGVGVAAVTVLGLGDQAQDRPQLLSLLLVAVLARSCARMMAGGSRPHPVLVAGTCLLWAQLHPLWILTPVAFGLVGLGAVVEDRHRHATAAKQAAICLLASLAGMISPQGPTAFVLPLRFKESTLDIVEWQPTTIMNSTALALVALVLLTFLACARSSARAPWTQLLWVTAWAALGMTAYRNLGPSLLLCAPVALDAADRAWGSTIRSWQRPSGPHEGAALVTATAVTVAVGLGVVVGQLARLDPLGETPARHLAERLATSPRPVRVFNDYNTSGSLVAFGGGKVRLAVDGRADLWGSTYIRKIISAQSLAPGWEATFTAFRPDAVVLTKNAPLAVLLLREGSWRTTGVDGNYVLLLPVPRPTSPRGQGPSRQLHHAAVA